MRSGRSATGATSLGDAAFIAVHQILSSVPSAWAQLIAGITLSEFVKHFTKILAKVCSHLVNTRPDDHEGRSFIVLGSKSQLGIWVDEVSLA